ncbi:bifunctional diaminohydroxyphosphoribosylaminopyrimidine deaminase/5-amino-6-(5-phosphoribosylamino)uracil reductase RibD [Muricauda sp. JGD-17]|uniref:Riboflavin biosynthesis protein RibD n=1 Tax=Flagellimonas ochracea TaxID=2696472 RepID=A0A964T9F5_9FLAO|nr:bifunctional diaminohydroxyphosphoribosylaminopyrimidine deaminase/5-amino-6-(5-phosphoribosylamino)uracil reductase RibD [Allomuricauda ochracea]NAY90695.1 bifunctional diaminohydroxyphosphoribosylaminopyrimidine deaminase/5-amino-6-(5-phosphoribosylamino)uracil reductase RibD [Allomuricauda ochracea]
MKIHQKYILRCLELGKKGLGTTAPNPMVGCVIVCDEKIIGEGFTSPYGGLHAEVNAINAVKNKSLLLKSTLYVSLEPCSHHGKTPPCSDLLIKHKIPRVVIGIEDPHEKVAGKGIKRLKEAGCDVTVGVLVHACRQHHKRFLCYHEKKRPYIILKWAETQDGFIAVESDQRVSIPEPFWISNRFSKQRVHQWRSEERAILVGTETVLKDNPKLSTRDWAGKSPIRIILDRNLRIPPSFHVFDRSTKTLVLTQITDASKYINNIDYEVIDFSKPMAREICKILYRYGITSMILEGGSKTLQTFISEGLWDEARIFKGAMHFERGLAAPKISGKLRSTSPILTDTLFIYTHD